MAERALHLFHKNLIIGNRLVRVEPGRGHLILAALPSGQLPDLNMAVSILLAAGATGLVGVYPGSPADFRGLPCIVIQFQTVASCKHVFQALRSAGSQPRGVTVQAMGYLYREA